MQNRPWTVAVDEFVVDFYKDTGTARTFQSQVRVLDDNKLAGEKRIKVNEPLDIGGVRFYQASWGMTGMIRSATLEIPRKGSEGFLVRIPRGERVPLQGTGLAVAAEMAMPDFTLDASGRPDTQGLEPNNPAVLISFYEKDERIASLWLLEKQPNVCFKVMPDETVEPAPHPPFRLRHFEPILFTGLQVAYDPGAKMVGYGCVALLVGLSLHFYFHQRRLRIFLTTGEAGGTRVQVGGWNSRHALDFDPEFRSLMQSLHSPRL
jgi:cytochrome c biogenesis protein